MTKQMNEQEFAAREYFRELDPVNYVEELEKVTQELRKQRIAYSFVALVGILFVSIPTFFSITDLAMFQYGKLLPTIIMYSMFVILPIVIIPVLQHTGGSAFNVQLKRDLKVAVRSNSQ